MLEIDDKLYNALLGYINESDIFTKEKSCKVIAQKLAEVHAEQLKLSEVEYIECKSDFEGKFKYILMG